MGLNKKALIRFGIHKSAETCEQQATIVTRVLEVRCDRKCVIVVRQCIFGLSEVFVAQRGGIQETRVNPELSTGAQDGT